MPKMTLLDMVQTILSDMNEAQVNSIDDAEVSNQVARIVRDTYYDLLNARLWPTNAQIINLVPSTDSNYPTYMKLPDDVYSIEWIKYNTKDQMSNDSSGLDSYKEIEYLYPDDFIDYLYLRDASASNVITTLDNLTTNGVKLLFINDNDPQYWTSFDDEWIVFDSYDATYDDTLQAQKSAASVFIEPSWTPSDTFIPDLPTKAFPLLLSESKKAAFIKLKQVADPVEVERARKQRTWLAGEKFRTRNKGFLYPDYGRN